MLDDDRRRLVELVHRAPGGVEVDDVVERQFLPLELAGPGRRPGDVGDVGVQRAPLVRVFPVAQRLEETRLDRQASGEGRPRLGLRRRADRLRGRPGQARVQFVADRRVVRGGVGERLHGEGEACFVAQSAILLQLQKDRLIVARVDDDSDVAMVLGGGPHHRGPADVDHLDQVLQAGPRARRHVAEGVEIDDHERERLDPGAGQVGAMRLL